MNAGHRRLISAPTHSAYLKIADGCSNRCSYCAIPTIRGKARSRTIDDIVEEAELLAAQGVRELIITAQDTTAYGLDRKGQPTLSRLLRALAKVSGISWIRVLYTYPAHLTEELLRTMAEEEKICRYLDIPIQHSDDAILRAMHRQGDNALIRNVIKKAREIVPDIALRTSLITGFPGRPSGDSKISSPSSGKSALTILGSLPIPRRRARRPPLFRPAFRKGKNSGAGTS